MSYVNLEKDAVALALQVGGVEVITADRSLVNLAIDAGLIDSGTLDPGRIPNLPASIINSGQFADDRISESSVKQHEGALAIGTDQLVGQLLDATVQQSNVTQYQAALSIDASQVQNLDLGDKNGWDLLAEEVLATAAASVTFDNLDSVLAAFRLQCFGIQPATGTGLALLLNGDTGVNYDHSGFQIDASTGTFASGGLGGGGTFMPLINTSPAVASSHAMLSEVLLVQRQAAHDVAVSAHTLVWTSQGAYRFDSVGGYDASAKLGEIQVRRSSGNFAAGSFFRLWGLRPVT